MDWLKEILKKAGIPEDKLDSTITDINKELPKHFIPKDKYNEVAEAKKKLEDDLKTRDQQLEDLKNAAGTNEDLRQQIKDLQEANEKATRDWETKLAQMQLDFAIDKALTAAKAKNPKAVKALLNMEKVKLDGEQLLGLDEQLKELQKSDAYLFGEPGRVGGGTNPPGGTEPKTIDQQIEDAVKAGNTGLAIRLKNEKYFFKKE